MNAADKAKMHEGLDRLIALYDKACRLHNEAESIKVPIKEDLASNKADLNMLASAIVEDTRRYSDGARLASVVLESCHKMARLVEDNVRETNVYEEAWKAHANALTEYQAAKRAFMQSL